MRNNRSPTSTSWLFWTATSTTVPAVEAAVAASLQEAIDDWIAGSTSAGIADAVRLPGGAE